MSASRETMPSPKTVLLRAFSSFTAVLNAGRNV
jgi:hypothetical protein